MPTHYAHTVELAADLDFSLGWQDVTIRLIAQRGVFNGKVPASTARRWVLGSFFWSQSASKQRRPSLGAPVAASNELYLEDEMAHTKISLPPPLSGRKYHLFCSLFNAGALTLAKELMDSNVFVPKGKGASAALTVTTDITKLADCDHGSKAVQPTLSHHRVRSHTRCFSDGQFSSC
jgi:hypothetical protein